MLSWPVLSIGPLFVLSLAISETEMVTFVPLSEMSSPCEGVTPVHCLPFSAGNIYILSAETFPWVFSNTCLNWRLFKLVLFNVKIWSVPYWLVPAITAGAISDFWAFAERVRNEQSYLGAGVKKKKKEDGMEQEKRKFAVKNFSALRLRSVIQWKACIILDLG